MADPQNPAESKPPVAPGADAQAPASVARPAPSSKNEPDVGSAYDKVIKSAEESGKYLEKLAEQAEKNNAEFDKRLAQMKKERDSAEAYLKEQESLIESGNVLAGETIEWSEELKETRKKIEELNDQEKKLAEERESSNEELGQTIQTIIDKFKSYGNTIKENQDTVKKLQEAQKDLTKVNKQSFSGVTELLKINNAVAASRKDDLDKEAKEKAEKEARDKAEAARRKSVDTAREKLEKSGSMDPKALAVFKGVNSGIEKLIDVAALNSEQQKQQIADMMKDEKEREKVTVAVSEGIRAEMEANQKTLKELQKKAESKDGFGGVGARLEGYRQMEALKKAIAESGATLEEIQKGGAEGTAAVEKLLDSQLAMSDEQRKQHIQAMERAAELDAQGIPPELAGLLDNVNAMRGLLKDIGIGQKGGFLKLIFVFLAATLGAWISAIFQRFLTLVAVIKGIPMAFAKIGGLIGNLGNFLSKFGSVGAKIGGFVQNISTFVIGIGTKLTTLVTKITGFGANVGAGIGKLSGIMTKLQKAFNVVTGVLKIFGGGGSGFLGILVKAFKFGFNFLAKIPFIGWIISAIIAILDVVKVFKALGDSKDSIVTKLMKGIVVALINFLTLGFLDFKKVLNFVNKLFADFPGTIKALFVGLFDKVVGFIKGIFSPNPGIIVKMLKALFLGLPGMIWGGIWSIVKSLFGKIVSGLASIPFIGKFFGGSGGQEGPSLIGGIMGKVKDAFGSVKEKLNEVFFSKIKAMMDMVLSVVKTVISGIKSIINAYVNAVTTIINAVVGVIRSVIDGIRKVIEAYYKGVVKVINLVVDVITIPLKIVKNALMDFADVVKQITGQVKNAIIGLFNKLAESSLGKFLGLKAIETDGGGGGASGSLSSGSSSSSDNSALLYTKVKSMFDGGQMSTESQMKEGLKMLESAESTTDDEGLKKNIKSLKGQISGAIDAKGGRIGKGTVTNNVAGAASEYAQAKSAKDAAQAQAASKPVVANNTTVMNRSSNTTQVTSAPSRYNSEPTLRGTQMGALPGMV